MQGEVFEPASESSTTPEIAEKSAKGEDEENHLHDLIEASCTENSALARALRRWDVALVAVGWTARV